MKLTNIGFSRRLVVQNKVQHQNCVLQSRYRLERFSVLHQQTFRSSAAGTIFVFSVLGLVELCRSEQIPKHQWNRRLGWKGSKHVCTLWEIVDTVLLERTNNVHLRATEQSDWEEQTRLSKILTYWSLSHAPPLSQFLKSPLNRAMVVHCV